MGGMNLPAKPKPSGAGTGAPGSRAVVMPEARALTGVIRRRRERLQLSLNVLARRAGISRQMLGYIENDQRVLTVDLLERVAVALHLTDSELLAAAEHWLARQPAQCRTCHYSCMARGELRWLNRRHDCLRPKQQATIPENPGFPGKTAGDAPPQDNRSAVPDGYKSLPDGYKAT